MFNYSLIENNANADKLFIKLLKEIEERKIDPGKEFTIKEVESILHHEKKNMHNSTYNQSILRMLSNINLRDYFIFKNQDSMKDISNECEKRNRRNSYWLEYIDEVICINKKYIL